MPRTWLVAWGTLARHLRVAAVARDLVLLAAIGALASFAMLFTSRVLFDNVAHELSLDYVGQSAIPLGQRADLAVKQYQDANVRKIKDGPLAGTRAVSASVLVGDTAANVTRLYGGAITAGAVCDDGILLDQATATRLDLGVGDHLMLAVEGVEQASQVRLCGLLNSWHPNNELGGRGYLVMSSHGWAVSAGTASHETPDGVVNYWFTSPPPGAQSKANVVVALFTEQRGWSSLVLGLFLISAALWWFGNARVYSGLAKVLQPSFAVLRELGVREFVGASFVAVTTLALATVGGFAATTLAQSVVLSWTGLYVQPSQVTFVSMLLVALSAATVRVAGMRRPLSRRPTQTSLQRAAARSQR